MDRIKAIFRREFRSYFRSPIAYIFISAFLITSSWFFFQTFFIINFASMRNFFDLLPWIFLFFLPMITMRLWAEEKKLGTIEVLMTLPVRDHEVVLGKYLASFAVLAVALVLTLPIPIIVAVLGNPDIGVIVSSYVGALLMGGAYLAIGLFVSSLTKNQIVAAIIGWVACFALFFLGNDLVLFNVPRFLVPVFEYMGLGAHFNSIMRGIIDSRDLIYYVSVIAFFLFLNVRVVESQKYR
ncbi:MAG: ABC transporter permease subunit [Candidatus Eiseniibacteriota bacterium]